MFGMRGSFGTKILVFVTALVVAVVGFITTKNAGFLMQIMKRQYNSALVDSTQLYGTRISNTLGRWDTKLSFFMQAMARAKPDERELIVSSFRMSESDLKGVIIFNDDDKKTLKSYPFDSLDISLTDSEFQALSSGQEAWVAAHPRLADILLFGRRIKFKAGDVPRYIVVSFDRNKLLPEESQDGGLKIFLLDANFIDLAKKRSYGNLIGDRKFFKKVRTLLRKEIGAGYLGELNLNRDKYYVAYQALHPYPLYVIVHQQVNVIQAAIQSFVKEIVQWTVLLVLFAVFIASMIVKGLLTNLRVLSLATKQIAAGNLNVVVPVKSQDEIGLLSSSFNWMTKKVAELLDQEREKARLEQELVTAQTVQNTFFKNDAIATQVSNITAFYKPASECGGDLWGHIKLNDGRELLFIGDATGHGAPAALVTALAYANVNIICELYHQGKITELTPLTVVQSLNKLLYDTLQGKLCMSMMVLIAEADGKAFHFCNAGHPFPVLIPESPTDSRLGAKKLLKMLVPVKKSSGIVGIDLASEFMQERFEIQAGDRLVLYTDGLTEAQNDQGKLWGARNLQKTIEEQRNVPAQDLRHTLIDKVIKFNAKGDQFDDDLTLVIIDFMKQMEQAA